MRSTNVKILVPPMVVVPRGARWVGAMAALARRAARALRGALEAHGRQRAGRALLERAAAIQAHDPALALQWRLAGRRLLDAQQCDAAEGP